MALNVEKYAKEHDAIIDYYKPIIRRNFIIGVILGVGALVLAFVALAVIFNTDSEGKVNGKLALGILAVAGIMTSVMGRFMSKRTAARKAMYRELNQLELARKQASISD